MPFQNNYQERIVLGQESGAHIVLDSASNAIQLWNGATLVGQWRAPSSGSDTAFEIAVVGDTESRFRISGDGQLSWGEGTLPPDLTLYRDNFGSLHLGGALTVDNTLSVDGISFSPANRRVYSLVDNVQANASGALAFPNSIAATVPTLVPGCQITLSPVRISNTHQIEIRTEFWCRNTNFTAGIVFIGQLYVNGVPDPTSLFYQPVAANSRTPMGRTFTYQGLIPGNKTYELYGSLSATPGVTGYSMEADRTTISGKLYE